MRLRTVLVCFASFAAPSCVPADGALPLGSVSFHVRATLGSGDGIDLLDGNHLTVHRALVSFKSMTVGKTDDPEAIAQSVAEQLATFAALAVISASRRTSAWMKLATFCRCSARALSALGPVSSISTSSTIPIVSSKSSAISRCEARTAAAWGAMPSST